MELTCNMFFEVLSMRLFVVAKGNSKNRLELNKIVSELRRGLNMLSLVFRNFLLLIVLDILSVLLDCWLFKLAEVVDDEDEFEFIFLTSNTKENETKK